MLLLGPLLANLEIIDEGEVQKIKMACLVDNLTLKGVSVTSIDSSGFPANENFREKMQNFAKMFFRFLQ